MNPSYKFYRAHLIKSSSDIAVEGFSFTKSDFEDLIDNFTPIDDIPVLLGCSKADLNVFCLSIYNADFSSAYAGLLAQAKVYHRKIIRKLAGEGNTMALKQLPELSGVAKESPNDISITILNDVPKL